MPFDADSDRDALVEETAFSTWTAVSRTTTPRVCWTYREVAPGIYESRSFDPEGRPLAHLDKGTKRMRIVPLRSEEHTSELQSLMRISYAVFCLKKKKKMRKHSRL